MPDSLSVSKSDGTSDGELDRLDFLIHRIVHLEGNGMDAAELRVLGRAD